MTTTETTQMERLPAVQALEQLTDLLKHHAENGGRPSLTLGAIQIALLHRVRETFHRTLKHLFAEEDRARLADQRGRREWEQHIHFQGKAEAWEREAQRMRDALESPQNRAWIRDLIHSELNDAVATYATGAPEEPGRLMRCADACATYVLRRLREDT